MVLIHSSKRLLLLTAVFCLAVGCSSEFSHLSETQQKAIGNLQEKGGGIGLDEDGEVVAINLSGRYGEITDYGMENLHTFPHLETIYLNGNCKDTHLKELSQISTLKHVWLGDTNRTITNSGFKHLEKLENLVVLQILAPSVTNDAFAAFSKTLPNCTIEPDPNVR